MCHFGAYSSVSFHNVDICGGIVPVRALVQRRLQEKKLEKCVLGGAQDQHSLRIKYWEALIITKYKRSEDSQKFQLDQGRYLSWDCPSQLGVPDDPVNKKTNLLKSCERGAHDQHSIKHMTNTQ